MNPIEPSSAREGRGPAGASPQPTSLDWARRAGMSGAVLQELEALGWARQRRRKVAVGWAIAVTAVLVVAAAITARYVSPAAEGVRVLAPVQKVLPDGSVVQLKSGTEIAVEYSPEARRVTLRQGTAHFHVAKNSRRPFVVTAGGLTVRAVGTQFSVDVEPQLVDVLVDEGKVAVAPRAAMRPVDLVKAPAPDSAMVAAGQRVEVAQDQLQADAGEPVFKVKTLSPEEVAAKMAWRVPRFDFSGTALNQVVAAFNGRNARKLILADPGLAELRLSGTLRVDNIAGLLQMLAQGFQVKAVFQGDEIILSREPAHTGA